MVIPVHNRVTRTLACLESLSRVKEPRFSIVVVDDGSSDGTAAIISRRFPRVTIVYGDGTLWWSGAVNHGIRHTLESGSSAVCLVNNDNTFAPDFLTRLMECMQRSGADAVCARVMDRRNGRVFSAGGTFHPWKGLRMRQAQREGSTRPEGNVAWCGGMGLLIKADALRRFGLFDARTFPQYYADADFCLRLQKHGGRLVYCPAAVVFNDPESTGISHRSGRFTDLTATLFSRRSHLNLAGTWRFYGRHRPLLLPLVLPGRLLRVCGGFLLHRRRKRKESR